MTGNASADKAVSREIGSGGKRRPPFPAVPLLVFAALAAAVSLAGLASYRGYAATHRARARVRLEALASHLAGEVGAWRDERFADAAIVASEPALARSLSRPRSQLDGDELVLWFEALRTQRHYAGVALLDTGGEPALAVGGALMMTTRISVAVPPLLSLTVRVMVWVPTVSVTAGLAPVAIWVAPSLQA